MQQQSSAPRELSAARSFRCLLAVQFLTVLNDNTFMWMAVALAIPVLGATVTLPLGLAGFAVPIILLASLTGYLSDRYSKTSVIRACKVAEIFILLLGFAAILSEQVGLLIGVIVLTGTTSDFFHLQSRAAFPNK